jgi:hypothetical protein
MGTGTKSRPCLLVWRPGLLSRALDRWWVRSLLDTDADWERMELWSMIDSDQTRNASLSALSAMGGPVAVSRSGPVQSRSRPFLPALAVSPSSFPSALVLFCANQSERLRVKFNGLHTALERAADQCPRLTGGDQIKKPLVLFWRPTYPRHHAVVFPAFSPSSTNRPVSPLSGCSRDARRAGHGVRHEPPCWRQLCPRITHTATNYFLRAHP